jgi:hypothetical protein
MDSLDHVIIENKQERQTAYEEVVISIALSLVQPVNLELF